jgi:hypothetical protein
VRARARNLDVYNASVELLELRFYVYVRRLRLRETSTSPPDVVDYRRTADRFPFEKLDVYRLALEAEA